MTDGVSDRLYAGKFKTVEELEAGYNNSAKVFQENEEVKRRLEESTKVPDDYQTPSDVQLHDNDIAQLKNAAKSSGLTQAQFDKLILRALEAAAARAKELGAGQH